jgi:hypothetical protein
MIRNHEWTRVLVVLALTLALGLALALVVGALAAPAGAAPAATASQPSAAQSSAADFSWNGALKAGQTVEIRGINGGVHAELAPGSDALVTARKKAHESDPDKVRIVAETNADGVTICVLYPDRHGRTDGDCDSDHGQHGGKNDVSVNFQVQLPRGVRLVTHMVNGSIEGHGLASEVVANTVNGSVRLSTSRSAEASTVNGSIETSVGSLDGQESLEFSTVNGSIVLRVGKDAGAEVEASTVNGHISTDFPITVSGGIGPRSIHGTIGAGGRTVKLTTVNGSIRLEKFD